MTEAVDLSIVVTGRHDNYGGDSYTRFLRTLRFNWGALREHGVACEAVLVEWNPIEGRPTLFDITRAQLDDDVASAFVGVIVDRRYHDACTQDAKLGYLEYLAKNVGIRRANGRIVLVTNIDIFLGRGVVESIARGALESGIVYRAARVDLALGSDQSRVTWDLLENRNAHTRQSTLEPPLFAGASGDFVLLDRASWHSLRGFNEVYRLARAGIDHNFLVKAYGCGFRIADLGHSVYHVNHQGSFRISKTILQDDTAQATWGNRRWHSRHVVYDNPEDWGLGNAPEGDLPGGARYLDFDWKAVPPVVDLRRVVLPLRRAR